MAGQIDFILFLQKCIFVPLFLWNLSSKPKTKSKLSFYNYILRLVYWSVFYKVHEKLVLLKMVCSCYQKQKPLRKFLMDQHVLRDIKLIYWVTV